MHRYIIRRFLYLIPMLLGISAISFFIMQLAPGDFLSGMKMNPAISKATIETIEHRFGLDLPVWQQYVRWVGNAVRGDFGQSFQYQAPVLFIIASRAWNTIILAASALALAWFVAIPIGIHAAVKQYSWSDKILTGFSFIGLSIPNYFLALLLLFFVVKFNIDLPIGGATSIDYPWMTLSEQIVDRIRHLLIPAVVLGTAAMASLMRYMRSNLLEELRQDYVTTAKSKGLKNTTVIYKHALRNAINPLITIFGFQLGDILGGAALTEIVTGWPGLGKVMLQAVLGLDYYLVMGGLIMSGMLLVVGNLAADIMLALVDPRIRYD